MNWDECLLLLVEGREDCEREMEKELRLVERMERLIRKDEEAEEDDREDDDNDCANLLGVKVLPVGTACFTWQVTDDDD
ncbi:hypothetical protein BY996DRAFT_6458355 [Phakopsora pachyrhizi]|uniref:Uncharacterized protein n=1 Tax=Phakopsora pachyrhizi TaxID=170000 RepID=A0AAV0AR00_PHAPC|nr:hypothetical protein BY996DRAFT_6458355 [Phakopsora pachyrhizi]CAH7671476.1 hypothetical protein PPACK8108_LOCUS6253 [Phakopsora pachyrhizi]